MTVQCLSELYILTASLCSSIFMPTFGIMIFVAVIVLNVSSIASGSIIVSQMNDMNDPASGPFKKQKQKHVWIFFFPPTACIKSICLNSFLKRRDGSLAHSAWLSCSRSGQLD